MLCVNNTKINQILFSLHSVHVAWVCHVGLHYVIVVPPELSILCILLYYLLLCPLILILLLLLLFSSFFFTFFLFFPLYLLCVHYRFVRFGYYIGDQFIEPYGSSGSLPLFSYYHDNYCSLLYVAENKLVVVVAYDLERPKRHSCRNKIVLLSPP